jgi:hypothetical protein
MSFDDSNKEPLHSRSHTEFIIEAGALAEGNLNQKFDDLEIAIQAALNEARKRIHEDLAAADIA